MTRKVETKRCEYPAIETASVSSLAEAKNDAHQQARLTDASSSRVRCATRCARKESWEGLRWNSTQGTPTSTSHRIVELAHVVSSEYFDDVQSFRPRARKRGGGGEHRRRG